MLFNAMFIQMNSAPALKLIISRIVSIISVFILLFVIWQLVKYWQINHWQKTILNSLATEIKANKTPTEQIHNKKINRAKSSLNDLSLMQVELPDVPQHSVMPSTLQKKADTIASTKVTKNKEIKELKAREVKPVRLHKSKQSVSAMYKQLTSDDSIDIEIAWPKNRHDRQDTFTYLYQCIGMRFGVLNGLTSAKKKVTLVNNYEQYNVHNNPRDIKNAMANNAQQVSDWLRIAQGQLANQEHHWMQKYTLTGTPVRLFPKTVDWQLAHLLTLQLKSANLTSFRARYQRSGDHLLLTNISVNGRLLPHDWTLISKKCSV